MYVYMYVYMYMYMYMYMCMYMYVHHVQIIGTNPSNLLPNGQGFSLGFCAVRCDL